MSIANRFTIQQLEFHHINASQDVLGMAEAFHHTYALDPAWGECYMCPACEVAYPAEHPGTVCTNNDCPYPAPLVDYWTTARILTDFYRRMSYDDSVCFIVKDNTTGKVIGSCQGLFLTPRQLTEELDLTGHIDVGACVFEHFYERQKIAYQSEIQIMPEFQKKFGLARELFLARHRHFYQLDPEGISVFRTQRGPKKTITYKWMIDGPMQYTIVAEYLKTRHKDRRDRVIAAQTVKACLDCYATKG